METQNENKEYSYNYVPCLAQRCGNQPDCDGCPKADLPESHADACTEISGCWTPEQGQNYCTQCDGC